MSTVMPALPQLPMELIDLIREVLSFDELWKVRRVSYWWNKMALRQARSLLYKDTTVRICAISTWSVQKSTEHPRTRVTWINSVLLAPQETSSDSETNLLVWGNKIPVEHELYTDEEFRINKGLDFYLSGFDIELPHTNSKRISLRYECSFWPMKRPGPIATDKLVQIDDTQGSEDVGVADWTIHTCQGVGSRDGQMTFDFRMKLPLSQLVEMYMKGSALKTKCARSLELSVGI